MEEKEIWKDVVGYEGYYMVSNLGRVKSLERTVWNSRGYRTVKERILKPGKNSYDYLQVHLHQDGKDKWYTVHKLVATAFCENPKGYTEVNHKDENKQNNCMENLEWCSRSYNNTYNGRAKKAGKKAGKKLRGRKLSEETIKKMSEKRSKPLYSINKESGLILEFPSAKEASRVLGINSSSITRCCQGKLKSCGGFYWMYANNNDDDTE